MILDRDVLRQENQASFSQCCQEQQLLVKKLMENALVQQFISMTLASGPP